MNDPAKASRRTVNSIFGEVLPEVPPDERDVSSPDDDDAHDRWLRSNIPPHHE
ncbi:hypothetical protein MMAG44476_26594 [Mycolicibacterium mageritense DSM 44476 = CIP 104973]|uniref:hypothetical protein n=1 Tax=Mycolicibacterium TaxID=1866885 RepID=UPI000ACF72E2|nr:hypothetical protein [Mycolicibacterium mageritense]MBN3458030.1 hypothetical protein [Mycobacterium sp. DSM 3803]MCC9181944.1 hypothetical protein [Mycolicibacterium mageritense]